MPMMLSLLVEDILLRILNISSVPATLAFGQTCKYFHALASSQSVWIALLADIDSRIHFELSEGESLRSYSLEMLIGLAKRAFRGPQSWCSLSSFSPPIVRRQIKLTMEPSPSFDSGSIFLLPGGQYMLIAGQKLECWRVPTRECIWTYEPQQDFDWHEILKFDAEMTKSGDAIVISVCLRAFRGTFLTHHSEQNIVNIVRLDLLSLTSQLLFVINIPGPRYAIESTRICGDLAAVVYRVKRGIVIINWRTQSHIHIPLLAASCGLTIVQGYLIILSEDFNQHRLHLGVWDIHDFAAHWVTGYQLSLLKSPDMLNVLPVCSQIISLPHDDTPVDLIQLSAHIHPFYHDLYTVWVYITSPGLDLDGPCSGVFTKFAFDLSSGLPPSLHVLDSSHSETSHLVFGRGGVSFTGHSVWINPGVPTDSENHVAALATYRQLLNMAAHKKSWSIFDEIPLELPGYAYQISAHNGALIFLHMSDTDTSVIIQYYE